MNGRVVEVLLHWDEPLEPIELRDDGLQVGELDDIAEQGYFKGAYRLSNSFHRELVNGVISELKKWGIKAVVQVTSDLTSEEFLRDLNQPDKLGVLLMGEPNEAVHRFCDNCSHALVLVDILHQSWPDLVSIDNINGVGQAVDHLVDLGHQDIGFVGWSENPSFRERKVGYLAKLHERGLRFRPEWCCESTVHIEQKTLEVTELLKQPNRPTALVCANDYQALSAIRAAGRLGLGVPGDLSVVGFDDIELAQYMTPALTTVQVPIAELGRASVRQLIVSKETREPNRSFVQQGCDVRIRAKLVERESTSAPKQ